MPDHDDAPTVTSIGVGSVDMSAPVALNLADLRGRFPSRTDRHLWIIGVMFVLANPETALDDMELTLENLVGFQPIHCLWCHTPYVTGLDGQHCAPA